MLDDLPVYIIICYVLVTLGDITSLSSCDATRVFFCVFALKSPGGGVNSVAVE